MNNSKFETWKERNHHCKSSGLTVSQWCDNNHLTKAKYYYWHKIITTSGSEPTVAPVFAEVVGENKDLSLSTLKVCYKNVELTLSSKNDISLAVEFIHALQSRC